MKTSRMILSAASVIPLLSSCASQQQTADNRLWNIKPAYNVRHATETPESYYRLGRYYQGQSRHEQALAAYQKALALDGAFAEARNGMGVIYALQGRQQEAIEQFRLAVKLAPNASHIHNNLGYALYLGKSYAEAVSALDRAVALNPANRSANTNLALALDKAGDREQAMQVMAEAAKPQPVVNAPAAAEAAQQAQTASAPAPAPAPAVAAAIPSPAPQQVLALPKDWGVITQAEPTPALPAENRIQATQVKSDAHELRSRTEAREQTVPAAKPLQQAAVQPMAPASMAAVQAVQKPAPAAIVRVRAVLQATVAAERPARPAVPAAKPYRIEVSNGNGVTGMARMVAGFLHKEGDAGARLTNRKPFNVASSQVQYRVGYRVQAQSLASALPGRPVIAQADNLRGDISVRVLLGKDIADHMAYFGQNPGKIRLVRNGTDF